jgi:hypothetical protein
MEEEKYICPHPACKTTIEVDGIKTKIPTTMAKQPKLGSHDAYMCEEHGVFIVCPCCPEMLGIHFGHVTMEGDDNTAELEVACELGKTWVLGKLDMTAIKSDILYSASQQIQEAYEDKEN